MPVSFNADGTISYPEVNSQKDLYENPFDVNPVYAWPFLVSLFGDQADEAFEFRRAFFQARATNFDVTEENLLQFCLDRRGRFVASAWEARLSSGLKAMEEALVEKAEEELWHQKMENEMEEERRGDLRHEGETFPGNTEAFPHEPFPNTLGTDATAGMAAAAAAGRLVKSRFEKEEEKVVAERSSTFPVTPAKRTLTEVLSSSGGVAVNSETPELVRPAKSFHVNTDSRSLQADFSSKVPAAPLIEID